jgi:adenylate cyclase
MTRAVVEERGTIDKFMGDCIMAFWGAPRPDPEMVVRSVRAALRMQDLIDVAMATGKAGDLKVKGCGVGLSVGEAVVGNIGSTERLITRPSGTRSTRRAGCVGLPRAATSSSRRSSPRRCLVTSSAWPSCPRSR